MKRDEILRKKDEVQKRLWAQGGKSTSGYVSLVHEKAEELRRIGVKLKNARRAAHAAR
jgi:hypothetical protein